MARRIVDHKPLVEPKSDQEAMEYRNRGNDRLNLGFNVVERNPDDLLLGHALYDKSVANDIDYEFSAELRPGVAGAAPVALLNRRLYPGSRYVVGDRASFTPPLGPLRTDGETPEGRVSVRYDAASQSYTYELAIAWSEVPELRDQLAALKPGEATAAAFEFLVTDGHKWDSQTRWCEEVGDIEFGAYGFDRRVGTQYLEQVKKHFGGVGVDACSSRR